MRSYFAAAFMGIGGVFVAFGAVVFIIEYFTSRTNAVHQLPAMTGLGLLTLVGGGALFALGYLLNRMRPTRTDGR